jgi:hypothetical protein
LQGCLNKTAFSYFSNMYRKLFSFLIGSILFTLSLKAQPGRDDTSSVDAVKHLVRTEEDTSHLRISLLTCGVGEELYSSFGHTAVRVVDSLTGMDIVFNYGTFSFGEDFYVKFVRGKLLYYVSYYDYKSFLEEYDYEKRPVEEQVILLPGEKKQQIYEFLRHNALPENRDYKYDFLFDNCATRIRDIFPKSLGGSFQFGEVIKPGERITFRDIIDQYLRNNHWARFGIDMALGSPIDKPMTNEDIMFLPDYLRDGLAGATLDGRKVMGPVTPVISGAEEKDGGINGPFLLTSAIALLTILGLTIPKLKILGKVMSTIILFVTGLLGVFFLFMWFGTDHQSCQNNYNILWALPTNLVLAFGRSKGAGRYSLVALVLLGISLLLHILRIQGLPLLELGPILLSLVFIYGTIYKRSKKLSKT